MSLKTKNHNLFKYEDNDIGDLRFINDSMDKIDKGLVLDVGGSTGTGNNYILNIGEIKLDSTTKGLKLSFFADKSSSGNVTINNNYNLLNANKSPIKNLKSGVPYTIVYDGGTNFFLASGGTDEVSFTSDKLLEGFTANDSDGIKVIGTMKNNGSVSQSINVNGNITLQKGYYNSITINQSIATKGATTITPTTFNQVISANQYLTGTQTILGDGNLRPENIILGKSIFGINGNATIQSLGGRLYTELYVDLSKVFHESVGFSTTNHFIDLSGQVKFQPSVIKGYIKGAVYNPDTYYDLYISKLKYKSGYVRLDGDKKTFIDTLDMSKLLLRSDSQNGFISEEVYLEFFE